MNRIFVGKRKGSRLPMGDAIFVCLKPVHSKESE
jgi:hypothetical protein